MPPRQFPARHPRPSRAGAAATRGKRHASSNPCIDPTSPQSKLPWCDDKLPIDARVKDMVGRIPLKEKLPLLDTGGSPVPSLGLSSYNWWSEASTGVASGRNTQTTKFAFPITTGMAFNRTLVLIFSIAPANESATR